MQQILYEAAVQMFFKIGVLKNLQIYQKKRLQHRYFPEKFAKLLEHLFYLSFCLF